jgi:Xaa-Pro aminopeptidase
VRLARNRHTHARQGEEIEGQNQQRGSQIVMQPGMTFSDEPGFTSTGNSAFVSKTFWPSLRTAPR